MLTIYYKDEERTNFIYLCGVNLEYNFIKVVILLYFFVYLLIILDNNR